jgi:DNA transposition AAA+ family ATPase
MTTTPVAAAPPPQLVEIEARTDDRRDTASNEIRIGDVSYVDTETSRRVMAGIEFARSKPSVVVISGAPGVGKSKASGARYCEDRKQLYWGQREGGGAV